MQELEKLRSNLRKEVNTLRSLDYIIGQISFENLWIVSDEKDKKRLLEIIEKRNKERLITWVKNHPSIDIGEKSLTQLRDAARDLGIKNYSRLSKIELLLSIKEAKAKPNKTPATAVELIEEMRKLIDSMQVVFNEAGIKEDYINLPELVEHFDLNIIQNAYTWITSIYNGVFREVKGIKILLPEEMWERYRAWGGFGDHREVVLLNAALQKFRKEVVTVHRPDLFKKTKTASIIKKIKKELDL